MPISVVILNWKRPFNLRRIILPRLVRHPLINEIIISHGLEESYFDYQHKSCSIINRKDWDLNQKYGLLRRFIAAQEAKNEAVMIQDDDILVRHCSISALFNAYNKERSIIHGLFGRYLDAENQYICKNTYGSVPIVGTKALMVSRRYFPLILDAAPLFEEEIKQGVPLRNGEDILLSLFVSKQSCKLNREYRLPKINLLYSEFSGISALHLNLFRKRNAGKLNHKAYRRFFSRRVHEKLSSA